MTKWNPIPGTDLEIRTIVADRESVREVWTSLSPRSYFLSWGWVENVLETIPKHHVLNLVTLRNKNNPVCAFLYGTSWFSKKFPFIRRRVFVNSTGNKDYDTFLWIVYNSMVASLGSEVSVFDILGHLPCNWRQVVLPGLDSECFPGNCFTHEEDIRKGSNGAKYKVTIENDLPAFYADLEPVRKAKGDVFSLLSSSRRAKLKRSYRLLQTRGAITTTQADSLEDALATFREMVSLHKAGFSRRNRKSNFINPRSIAFHEKLIHSRFHKGEIQLLRIETGQQVLGCIYGFVYNRKIYAYQNGFTFFDDNRINPGLTCHCEAIKHNAALGFSSYDFLSGDEPYKSFFTEHHNRIIWVTIDRADPVWKSATDWGSPTIATNCGPPSEA